MKSTNNLKTKLEEKNREQEILVQQYNQIEKTKQDLIIKQRDVNNKLLINSGEIKALTELRKEKEYGN